MKIIAFQIIFTLTFYFSFGQGNLQFNKVIFIEADTTINCISTGPCADSFLIRDIIVPTGKVLKIESINTRGSSSAYSLYLNTMVITKLHIVWGIYMPNIYPIWLPAGTYRIKYYEQYSNPTGVNISGRFDYQLSAIEFNIVQ